MDSTYAAPLDRALRAAVAFLDGHTDAAVGGTPTRADLVPRLHHPLHDALGAFRPGPGHAASRPAVGTG